MEARNVKVRTLSIATSLLLLVVLLLVNTVFARSSMRLDLTDAAQMKVVVAKSDLSCRPQKTAGRPPP